MGIFAPIIRRRGSTWYVTVGAFQRRSRVIAKEVLPECRRFYVKTDDIWKSGSWSDPVFYDVLGIDQDVSLFDFGVKLTVALLRRRWKNLPVVGGSSRYCRGRFERRSLQPLCLNLRD